MSKNRVIGNHGQIPWRISEDLSHFANLTKGHPVIMGRKTYESLPSPLKDRTVIVVSRSLTSATAPQEYKSPMESKEEELGTASPQALSKREGVASESPKGTIFVDSVDKALEVAKTSGGSEEIFIAGGGQIYNQYISLAGKIYLTVIDAEVEGDTLFPKFNTDDWELIKSRKRFAQVLDQSVVYSFEEWVRR